jgi:hypothetical protein
MGQVPPVEGTVGEGPLGTCNGQVGIGTVTGIDFWEEAGPFSGSNPPSHMFLRPWGSHRVIGRSKLKTMASLGDGFVGAHATGVTGSLAGPIWLSAYSQQARPLQSTERHNSDAQRRVEHQHGEREVHAGETNIQHTKGQSSSQTTNPLGQAFMGTTVDEHTKARD